MAAMPAMSPIGPSDSIANWFASPAGQALLDSETVIVDRALGDRPGQPWLWLAPVPAATLPEGRGLHLVRAAHGWRGAVDCDVPLPLPSEAFGTVLVQHVLRLGDADSDALLSEVARILMPGGRLWLFALNPLAPYRWHWRSAGLSCAEPLSWRRRLRLAGLVPDPVSQGLGPRWKPQSSQVLQHGAGLRAAYVMRAEKRQLPLTPVRGHRFQLTQGAPAA